MIYKLMETLKLYCCLMGWDL